MSRKPDEMQGADRQACCKDLEQALQQARERIAAMERSLNMLASRAAVERLGEISRELAACGKKDIAYIHALAAEIRDIVALGRRLNLSDLNPKE
ncbi:MAG: hypothetical protein QMD09_09150 [Desulfatibacillaceae bacterium]|nr:hypothetical protein [Desulfatibacillaceae bacterium]